MSILEELSWRGLVADCTDHDGLQQRLAQRPLTLYAGFDPTSDSLHVGNLVPLLALRRFQLFSHRPIALAGGATGLVGDPSGKSSERHLLTREQLDQNIDAIKQQLRRLLDFDAPVNPAQLVDNAAWTAPVTFLEFLRDVGKHITVNVMIAKESVRARMEDRESGISYAEFSYMLLQGFDFAHLKKEFDCDLQIGGSDQWGNITIGIELARKKFGAHLFGLTLPLITNADGSKFGKSVAGAIWLDPRKTSTYRFYQFWIRTDDRDVIRYLKYFTFLSQDQITQLEEKHTAKPEDRDAHKALASAMTDLIHSPSATLEAVRASEVLFGGDLEGILESTFDEIAGEIPSRTLGRPQFDSPGLGIVDLLVTAGLSSSKGQARKDIEGGGIYINNRRESNPQRLLATADLLFGKHLLLRKGKRNYTVITAA